MTGHSIMGLVDPPGRIVGGRIVFAGRDLTKLSDEQMRQLRGNRIAMLFRDPMLTLNPVLRIDTQMVETVLAHEPIARPAARARAREALAKVGMPSPESGLKAYPHQISGGMRQRVALAIALINRPDLIIADEPTTALDVTIQARIVFEMQQLTREAGTALIWITRDLALIAGLADRVAVMYAGRIVEQGYTEDVLRAPRHPYTRGLLDSMPGSAPLREKFRQTAGMSPTLTDLPPGCAFRPRCPYASAECAQAPEMRDYGASGQALRCFHPLPPPG
jgi:peptide/nickel transport system ATP-binding protein